LPPGAGAPEPGLGEAQRGRLGRHAIRLRALEDRPQRVADARDAAKAWENTVMA
jgi:hypothetical protein